MACHEVSLSFLGSRIHPHVKAAGYAICDRFEPYWTCASFRELGGDDGTGAFDADDRGWFGDDDVGISKFEKALGN